MTNTLFDAIGECSSLLKIDFTAEEFTPLAEVHNMSNSDILAAAEVFEYPKEKKSRTLVVLFAFSKDIAVAFQ